MSGQEDGQQEEVCNLATQPPSDFLGPHGKLVYFTSHSRHTRLAAYFWPCQRPRGIVLLAHGELIHADCDHAPNSARCGSSHSPQYSPAHHPASDFFYVWGPGRLPTWAGQGAAGRRPAADMRKSMGSADTARPMSGLATLPLSPAACRHGTSVAAGGRCVWCFGSHTPAGRC